MRTHGHREGHITPGACGAQGARGGLAGRWGAMGGMALGEIPNVDDRGMDAAKYHGTCIPM